MKLKSLRSLLGDVLQVRKLRAELTEEKTAADHLRCALEAELSNGRATDAVVDAYRQAHGRLSVVVTEVVIPALQKAEKENPGDGPLAVLEEALSGSIDEDEIREEVMRADGWS